MTASIPARNVAGQLARIMQRETLTATRVGAPGCASRLEAQDNVDSLAEAIRLLNGEPDPARKAWDAACLAWSRCDHTDALAAMKLGEALMYAATDLIVAQETVLDFRVIDPDWIAKAITDADTRFTYDMTLTELVKGRATYRLTIAGQPRMVFQDGEVGAMDQCYQAIAASKNRARADAIQRAMGVKLRDQL